MLVYSLIFFSIGVVFGGMTIAGIALNGWAAYAKDPTWLIMVLFVVVMAFACGVFGLVAHFREKKQRRLIRSRDFFADAEESSRAKVFDFEAYLDYIGATVNVNSPAAVLTDGRVVHALTISVDVGDSPDGFRLDTNVEYEEDGIVVRSRVKWGCYGVTLPYAGENLGLIFGKGKYGYMVAEETIFNQWRKLTWDAYLKTPQGRKREARYEKAVKAAEAIRAGAKSATE